MLRKGCNLKLQLQIYLQTLTYPGLEEVRVESLDKLKYNTLEHLKNDSNCIGLKDKQSILEARIKLFESRTATHEHYLNR